MFLVMCAPLFYYFFFFNDTATTEIYTLSLHDALPISHIGPAMFSNLSAQDRFSNHLHRFRGHKLNGPVQLIDRKSTRLNSSHMSISYAVFCLKKKKKK